MGCRTSRGRIFAPLLLCIYLITAVVLLLNMLIAMMAKTFDKVWEAQGARAPPRPPTDLSSPANRRCTLTRLGPDLVAENYQYIFSMTVLEWQTKPIPPPLLAPLRLPELVWRRCFPSAVTAALHRTARSHLPHRASHRRQRFCAA